MDVEFNWVTLVLHEASQSRYMTQTYPGGSLLRINPVRPFRDETNWDCVAENGVGDPVTATAQLVVYEGKFTFF